MEKLLNIEQQFNQKIYLNQSQKFKGICVHSWYRWKAIDE
jgi:hypothetical protein